MAAVRAGQPCAAAFVDVDTKVAAGYDALPVTVYREETDCLGIVFYRHFLAWFERSREHVISTQFLNQLYADTGESFVVTRSEQLFKAPARFGDQLEVRTVPFLDGQYRLHFDQSIWRTSDNTVLVTGFVEMVTVSKEFALVQVPRTVQELITKFEPCQRNFTYCMAKEGGKLPAPKRPPAAVQQQAGEIKQGRFELTIHQADSDFTGIAFHPNYYCWFERARTEMLTRQVLAAAAEQRGAIPVIRSAKLQYKSGARPYEPLVITTELRKRSSEPEDYVVALDQRMLRTLPDGKQQSLVHAQIDVVFVDKLTKALVKIPSIVRDRLRG